jgi:hypothetical protein
MKDPVQARRERRLTYDEYLADLEDESTSMPERAANNEPGSMTVQDRAARIVAEVHDFLLDEYDLTEALTPVVVDVIRAAVAEERESCAKLAENHPYQSWQMNEGERDEIAAAIRARA